MLQEKIQSLFDQRRSEIYDWLAHLEDQEKPPLYSSVDIRNAGFKMAVVDTNLFPAGFNNLCHLAVQDGSTILKEAILSRAPRSKRVLILTEEHTRNRWYFENIFVLLTMLKSAGFDVYTASFCDETFDETGFKFVETEKKNQFKLYCYDYILSKLHQENDAVDFVLLNNDLSKGVPKALQTLNTQIYPPLYAGWHSRSKHHHFEEANHLLEQFARLLDCDPWYFQCIHDVVDQVNINNQSDRERLADSASRVFEKIKEKYAQYGLKEKPFIFIKSDFGTYGMGVLPVESPDDILQLNRKARNRLYKGKHAQVNDRFLIQEGVPTIHHIDNKVSEACIYQISNQFIGGFYRLNEIKSVRENLNSQGMTFQKMCDVSDRCVLKSSPSVEDCGIELDSNLTLYRILARLAGIAAQRELNSLKEQVKTK